MARKKNEQIEEKAPEVVFPESLILTISELQSLSPEDQERFRQAGGTSIENPKAPQD
jgi:hypothetical protein